MSAFGELLTALRVATIVTVVRTNQASRWRVTGPMSQNELALRAGVDPAYVNKLERGIPRQPRRAVVERICDALEVASLARAQLLVAAGYWPYRADEVDDPLALVAVVVAVAEGDYRRLADDVMRSAP